MSSDKTKVGIISCSGEAIPEGSISRLATRRVLELLRSDVTVTLCLPLFLAGNDGERNFARTHPTITVDGCAKQCARWGTERHSGPVSGALVVTDILGTSNEGCHCSSRELSEEDTAAVWAVAERIAGEVDRVLAASAPHEATSAEGSATSCGYSTPVRSGTISINGQERNIHGLPLIFEQCAERGVPASDADGSALLDVVKIYHSIAPEDEPEYRLALVQAYQAFKSGTAPVK